MAKGTLRITQFREELPKRELRNGGAGLRGRSGDMTELRTGEGSARAIREKLPKGG